MYDMMSLIVSLQIAKLASEHKHLWAVSCMLENHKHKNVARSTRQNKIKSICAICWAKFSSGTLINISSSAKSIVIRFRKFSSTEAR
ncbi:hypothetical protein BD560DRAFT_489552 [Blakeslea trispora]|nr:hypothetical protein BD560DRAFT_489552 [Blakeslea trispora]